MLIFMIWGLTKSNQKNLKMLIAKVVNSILSHELVAKLFIFTGLNAVILRKAPEVRQKLAN